MLISKHDIIVKQSEFAREPPSRLSRKTVAKILAALEPYKNNEKIIHFFRNLSKHLTKKIYHLNEIITYAKYVKEVKQTTNQMKVRSDMKQFTTSSMFNVKNRNFRQVDIVRKKIFLKKFIKKRFKAEEQAIIEEVLMRLSI